MRSARGARVRRGSIAATIATFVALLSHVSAGAEAPGWLGIAVPWILAVACCTVLVGKSWGLIRLSAAVVVSQALFHVLFVLGTVTPSGVVSTGHNHGAMVMPMPASTATAGTALLPDASMLVGHLVAAILTVLALRRGERATAALSELVAGLVARVVATLRAVLPPAHRPAPRLRAVFTDLPSAYADPASSPRSLRGPPLLVVA